MPFMPNIINYPFNPFIYQILWGVKTIALPHRNYKEV